jgi:RND family efflux transporter MFP subunit
VDLGDTVVRDQVLAAIRPVDYRARVSELDAALTQAQSDLKRAQALGSAGTAEEVELARTRLAEAKAQRTLASRQLGDTTVRAPFAGAVAARHAAQGTYVKTGTVLFDLVTTDRLRLSIEVPERYAAVVVVGTPVAVTLSDAVGATRAPGTVRVEAELTRISPVVSPTNRTFMAEAVFSPAGSVLKPGMFVVAELALGNEEASVRVPRAAVFHVLGRDRVMKVVDGLALPQDIELIAEVEAEAVVVGLPAGTPVISRGAALVAPGTPVVPEVAQ